MKMREIVFAGGKAFGKLRQQQENTLDEVNKVMSLYSVHRAYFPWVGAAAPQIVAETVKLC